jgi:two-component sensor histidine kinase
VNGNLFIATYSHGILTIKNKKAYVLLNKKTGLFSDIVYKFQVDENKFWMVEDGMVQCYDTTKKMITNYSYTDGLPRAEVKDLLIYKSNVYVATTEGLLVFDKNQNTKNAVSPGLAITGFKVNNSNRNFSNDIELNSDENNIDIFFSVLSYRGEGALTIKYKINEGEWLTVQQDARVLQLTALASDKYKIQIQAYNEDGVGEDSALQISFTIATPWYRRWYFIAAAVLFTLFLLYGYFKRRIYLINKNNALAAEKLILEQEVQKSKLASIKSQMNPHFLFNALNTIQSYIYTNDKENASIYLGKFSDLTRSILEMSNNETISLSEEIRTLNLYLELEQLRFEDTLEYKIVYDEKLNVEFIHIPSMLIQPYVENALKHGLLHKRNNRILNITFTKEEKILKVCIEDNGVGRKRSAELNELKTKQHKSFAVTANQKRLEILNSSTKNNIVMTVTDKYDEAGEAAGTVVEILIPVKG